MMQACAWVCGSRYSFHSVKLLGHNELSEAGWSQVDGGVSSIHNQNGYRGVEVFVCVPYRGSTVVHDSTHQYHLHCLSPDEHAFVTCKGVKMVQVPQLNLGNPIIWWEVGLPSER